MNFLFISIMSYFAFFSFSSCSTHTPYSMRVDKVFGEFNNELKKEGKLRLFGFGSSNEWGIEHWQFDYRYKGSYNINEVRRMYIPLVEQAIAKVNDDKKMQPLLKGRPFDWRNIQIAILFADPNDHLVQPPSIVFVSRSRDMIFYCVDTGGNTAFKIIYEEPYEEALRIFREEQNAQYTQNKID